MTSSHQLPDDAPPVLVANRLLTELAFFIDHQRATESLALYAADLEFVTPNGAIGREGLAQFLKAREEAAYRTRHAVSNVRLSDVQADQFEASCIVLVQRLDDGRASQQVADWKIACVRETGDWKVRSFAVTPFYVPGAV